MGLTLSFKKRSHGKIKDVIGRRPVDRQSCVDDDVIERESITDSVLFIIL